MEETKKAENTEKAFVSSSVAASIIGVTRNVVSMWCARGKINGVKRWGKSGPEWKVDINSVPKELFKSKKEVAESTVEVLKTIPIDDPRKEALLNVLYEYESDIECLRAKMNYSLVKTRKLIKQIRGEEENLDI